MEKKKVESDFCAGVRQALYSLRESYTLSSRIFQLSFHDWMGRFFDQSGKYETQVEQEAL